MAAAIGSAREQGNSGGKKPSVLLTDSAARDLEEIHDYIREHDSHAAAEPVLSKFEKTFKQLEQFPNRGDFPRELLSLGIRDYRESFFKPYRIIYRVTAGTVFVHLIADGRRDMRTLLAKRLLWG